MEESLKSSRVIHHLILAICAATISFAVSPNRVAPYDDAIAELQVLRDINVGTTFDEYVREVVDTKFGKEWAAAVDRGARPSDGSLISITTKDSVRSASSSMFFQYDLPPSTGSCEELLRYFRNAHSIVVFKPEFAFLEGAVRTIAVSVPAATEVRAIRFGFSSDESLSTQSSETVLADVEVTYKILDDTGSARRRKTEIPGRLVLLEGKGFRDWFNSLKEHGSLTTDINGATIVFPRLLLVWDEIRHADIETALVILKGARDRNKRQLSFLGFSVDERLATIASPIALLLALFYLLANIHHLMSDHMNEPNLARQFPWICLFDGWLSWTLTLLSMIAIPLVANTLIIVRSWDGQSPSSWIAAALALCTLVGGVVVSHEISQVKQRLASG